ncbi:MAG: hypothetical protein P8Y28_02530 [Gammaproteobacteria bacterium]|jgi:hypothetical protein
MTNSTVNRIFRVVFGSSLIVATMAINSAPLGGFAILPLVAIPVILSGLYGENLIGELTAKPVTAMKARVSNNVAKIFKRNAVAA